MMLASPGWTSCCARITAPAHRRDVTHESLNGEALLYDPTSGDTIRLNETAFGVWRLCDGQTTLGNIAGSLIQLYDVDIDTALDHTEQLVAYFAAHRLLEPPNPA